MIIFFFQSKSIGVFCLCVCVCVCVPYFLILHEAVPLSCNMFSWRNKNKYGGYPDIPFM